MTAENIAQGGSSERTAPAPTRSLPPYVWKSAYGVLVAMAVTVPLGVGFFVYEGVFALLSDLGGLLVGLVLAPLVWGMYLLHRDDPLDRGVLGVGVVAVAGIVVGSLGLSVMYLLSLEPETYGEPFLGIQFLGWLLLGVWLLGVGVLSRRIDAVSDRTAWTAIVAGVGTVGGIVTLVYSYAVGEFTLLFPLFMLAFVVGFLLWAFWLGGELRASARRTSNATSVAEP